MTEKTGIQKFLENPYDDEPFGTKEEKRATSKENNLIACNQPVTMMQASGILKQTSLTCKIYRHCDKFCRHAKFEEIEKRLNHAQAPMVVGNRLRYDTITEEEKEACFKKISRHDFDYYSFPQPNNQFIIIHNDPDGIGDELWDYGYDDIDLYNEDNGYDLNFYTILKNVPEGKKISGNLGRPDLDEEEDEKNGSGADNEEEAEETYSVKYPCLYKAKFSERDINLAYEEAVTKTQNITVTNEIELEAAMFARINAMNDALNGNYTVLWIWGAVTAEEIESWNQNANNFTKIDNTDNDNVRISTIENPYSRYSDSSRKSVSGFDAVLSRSDRGDDMDQLRQEAIQDYLRHHGT